GAGGSGGEGGPGSRRKRQTATGRPCASRKRRSSVRRRRSSSASAGRVSPAVGTVRYLHAGERRRERDTSTAPVSRAYRVSGPRCRGVSQRLAPCTLSGPPG